VSGNSCGAGVQVFQQLDQFLLEQLSLHPHLFTILIVAVFVLWLVRICDRILAELLVCARKVRRIWDELSTPSKPKRAA